MKYVYLFIHLFIYLYICLVTYTGFPYARISAVRSLIVRKFSSFSTSFDARFRFCEEKQEENDDGKGKKRKKKKKKNKVEM